MRILVSGATGFLGEALVPRLVDAGHRVVVLTRAPDRARGEAVGWDPAAGRIDAAGLKGLDAAVHLAGESLFAPRWTEAKRRRIRESRTSGTALLARTLAGLEPRPKVLVSASAVGWYGEGGDAVLTEASPPGEGFLAEVCRAWEAAADPAREAGLRVVHPRFGVVLDRGAVLLKLLLPAFRAGLGAYVGPGGQWMSWIHRADLVEAVLRLLEDPAFEGPVNVTSPEPATQRAFGDALARVLSRPRLLKVPSPAIRLGLGQMGQEMVLVSQRVVPERLAAAGFVFRHPEVGEALAASLR